jgi:metal-responsive CopG/Arc/MetJ family transcriptional regulator
MIEQDKNQKEAVNLSLSSTLVEKVEDIIFELRKKLPREKRKKLNRSRFFELALEAIIKDYENSGQKSRIFKIVMAYSDLSI